MEFYSTAMKAEIMKFAGESMKVLVIYKDYKFSLFCGS